MLTGAVAHANNLDMEDNHPSQKEDDMAGTTEDDSYTSGGLEDRGVPEKAIENTKYSEDPEVPDITIRNMEDSLSTPLLDKEVEEASLSRKGRPTLVNVAPNPFKREI